MVIVLLTIPSPLIMARHSVHGIRIQLVVLVNRKIVEAGGTWTSVKLVVLTQILTASITKFTGQTWPFMLKAIPQHLKWKSDQWTFAFPKASSLRGPIILFREDFFCVSWNNCLYEIVYQILLQGSVMFSGGLIKLSMIYQATWLIW